MAATPEKGVTNRKTANAVAQHLLTKVRICEGKQKAVVLDNVTSPAQFSHVLENCQK